MCFNSSKWVKTRVPHICEMCGNFIIPGSEAYNVVGKWDGEFQHHFLCDYCYELQSDADIDWNECESYSMALDWVFDAEVITREEWQNHKEEMQAKWNKVKDQWQWVKSPGRNESGKKIPGRWKKVI